MMVGWRKRYSSILKKLNYSQQKDKESALILDSILKKTDTIEKLKKIIGGKTVFVIGFWTIVSKCHSKIKKVKKIHKNCS